MYILAGDGEVLVDEIVYLAHKAAYPASYPLRQGAMNSSRRQQENAKKFTAPTNVHLQVYDGMPHVLTIFGYTESVCLVRPLVFWISVTLFQAGYAYRSISQFVKHVTKNTAYLGNFPFPELYKKVTGEESVCDSDSEVVKRARTKPKSKSGVLGFRKKPKDKSTKEQAPEEKGNEGLSTSAAPIPALPSRENLAVAEGVATGIEESDKEEGTSSAPQVRAYEKVLWIGF